MAMLNSSGGTKPNEQLYMVTWIDRSVARDAGLRDGERFASSHEVEWGRTPGEAMQRVQDGLDTVSETVAAYNEGQVLRMVDFINRTSDKLATQTRTKDRVKLEPYVAFYERTLGVDCPALDRLCEGWIIAVAPNYSAAQQLAYQHLDDYRLWPFLTFDLGCVEIVFEAMRDSRLLRAMQSRPPKYGQSSGHQC